ncbi:MAG: hypothetical protein M3083_11730 [Actinomycetota bacterium]|nr:hypothetical protein [Actinomycetota bacterium]MDQ6949315.1 hypothetical protein [Actinomycetota bacterium]
MPCIAPRARPLVLHGSLTTFRRRCGKASCHCASGDAHESPALIYTEAGSTKTLTLRAEEVAEVTAALARYEAARVELEAAAMAGIAALRARRPARGARGGRR